MLDWKFLNVADMDDDRKYYRLELSESEYAVEYQPLHYLYDLPHYPLQKYPLPKHMVVMAVGPIAEAIDEGLCVSPQIWGMEILYQQSVQESVLYGYMAIKAHIFREPDVLACMEEFFDLKIEDEAQLRPLVDCRLLTRDPDYDTHQYSVYREDKILDPFPNLKNIE